MYRHDLFCVSDQRVNYIINSRTILRRKFVQLLSKKRIFHNISVIKDIRKDHVRRNAESIDYCNQGFKRRCLFTPLYRTYIVNA